MGSWTFFPAHTHSVVAPNPVAAPKPLMGLQWCHVNLLARNLDVQRDVSHLAGGRGWNSAVWPPDAQPNLCISTASFPILKALEKLLHSSSAEGTMERWGPKQFWGTIPCVKTPAMVWKIGVSRQSGRVTPAAHGTRPRLEILMGQGHLYQRGLHYKGASGWMPNKGLNSVLTCTTCSPSAGWLGVPVSSQFVPSEAVILVGLYYTAWGLLR